MKRPLIIVSFLLMIGNCLLAQDEQQIGNFYIGISYGTSFAVGDFKDKDISNPDAGLAQNGNKFDIYAGWFLDKDWTLTSTFRYQAFETEVLDLISMFNTNSSGSDFEGNAADWEVYSLLIGMTYEIPITKKFRVYPVLELVP